MSKSKYALLFVAVALMFVVFGWKYVTASSEDGEALYRFANVKRGELKISTLTTGRIKAVDSVEVSSQLSGQVVKLYADFNDAVTFGAPLAQLDDKTFKAALAESQARLTHVKASHDSSMAKISGAKAHYEEAKKNYQRKTRLLKVHGVAAQEVDKAYANMVMTESEMQAALAEEKVQSAAIKEAEAALNKAEIDLARTVIRSPIDGTVLKRTVELGQTVAVSMTVPTLFTIARDLRHMRVHARVDEADVGRIAVGQNVQFSVDSYTDRTFAGRVLNIYRAPEIVQNVVTYTVVITADNSDLALFPGMTVVAHIMTTEHRNTLLVPNAALRFEPKNKKLKSLGQANETNKPQGHVGHVWLRSNSGMLTRGEINIGKNNGSVTEVISGPVSEGQAVAVGKRPLHDEKTLFGIRLGF
jgi:HlyD family secretion protein